MSIWNFVLNAAVINAHASLRAISAKGTATPRVLDLDIHIINELVALYIAWLKIRRSTNVACRHEEGDTTTGTAKAVADGAKTMEHMLLENVNKRSVHCYMCKLKRSNCQS